VFQGLSEGGLVSGQQAIKKRYEADLASSPSLVGKLVQVYEIGNEVCAITQYQTMHHIGYALTISVREADDWKIRMHYAN
jgi:hypothetical protein